MNAPWITGEHSKLLIHMVMRAFLLDVAIYTPITKDFLLPLDWKFEDCCSLLYLYLLFHVLLPTQYPICLHSFRTHEQDYSQCA